MISIVYTLKPIQSSEASAAVPAWLGRAAHALVLNLINKHDQALSVEMHDPAPADLLSGETSNSVRPFTASTLMGRFQQHKLDPQGAYFLRLTAFRPDVEEILMKETQSGELSTGSRLELDYLPFEVLRSSLQDTAAMPDENDRLPAAGWSGQTNFQELSAPYLLAAIPAPKRITLQLTSPTVFKSAGRHMPVPLPELVFGSLLDRWNAFAPVNFPVEVRRFAEECLAISQYDLQTRPVPQKGNGLRMGAVGRVTFTALHYDRYWMSILAALASFSLYSGLGAGTTQGLGQCRMLSVPLSKIRD